MKKLIKWVLDKIQNYKNKKRIKAKIKELKKRDPFTYNH